MRTSADSTGRVVSHIPGRGDKSAQGGAGRAFGVALPATASMGAAGPPLTRAVTILPLREDGPGTLSVLMGQIEVFNALRSAPGPDGTRTMPYAGELRFLGGQALAREEILLSTAERELRELGFPLAEDSHLSAVLFSQMIQNSPRGRCYQVCNFVAPLEDGQNRSVLDVDLSIINRLLQRQREDCQSLIAEGKYWDLPESDRMRYSPRLRRVLWISVADALRLLDPAKAFVDDWQREEFSRHGLAKREVATGTYDVLAMLDGLGTVQAIREASLQVRWMSAGERSREALPPQGSQSLQRNSSTPSLEDLEHFRDERLRSSVGGHSSSRGDSGRAPPLRRSRSDSASSMGSMGSMGSLDLAAAAGDVRPYYAGVSTPLGDVGTPRSGDGTPMVGIASKTPVEPSAVSGLAVPSSHGVSVKVLSYNLNALPFGATLFATGQGQYASQRLRAFARRIAPESGGSPVPNRPETPTRPDEEHFDVLALQEVFSTPALPWLCHQRMLVRMLEQRGFRWVVSSPQPGIRRVLFSRQWTDSGLLILSRYPIEESHWLEFTHRGISLDAGAAKGALHARIRIGDRRVHVFNCHLQATHTNAPKSGAHGAVGGDAAAAYAAIRLEQLRELVSFVEEWSGSDTFPVLITGDFNIDAVGSSGSEERAGLPFFSSEADSAEYTMLMRILDRSRAHGSSSTADARVIDLLKERYHGRHVSTRPPRMQFPKSPAYAFRHKYPQRLDYVMFQRGGLGEIVADVASTRVVKFPWEEAPRPTDESPKPASLSDAEVPKHATKLSRETSISDSLAQAFGSPLSRAFGGGDEPTLASIVEEDSQRESAGGVVQASKGAAQTSSQRLRAIRRRWGADYLSDHFGVSCVLRLERHITWDPRAATEGRQDKTGLPSVEVPSTELPELAFDSTENLTSAWLSASAWRLTKSVVGLGVVCCLLLAPWWYALSLFMVGPAAKEGTTPVTSSTEEVLSRFLPVSEPISTPEPDDTSLVDEGIETLRALSSQLEAREFNFTQALHSVRDGLAGRDWFSSRSIAIYVASSLIAVALAWIGGCGFVDDPPGHDDDAWERRGHPPRIESAVATSSTYQRQSAGHESSATCSSGLGVQAHAQLRTYDGFLDVVQRGGFKPCLGARQMNAEATSGPYEWMSYSEVWDQVTAFGSGLSHVAGAARGTRVGILCNNCVEWVVADLACSSFSFVSVVMHCHGRSQKLFAMLQEANVDIILCSRAWTRLVIAAQASGAAENVRLIVQVEGVLFDEQVTAHDANVQLFDSTFICAAGRRHPLPHVPPLPDDLASVVFSWDSHGAPRGNAFTHRALATAVHATVAQFDLYNAGHAARPRKSPPTYCSYLPLAYQPERVMLHACLVSGVSVGFRTGSNNNISALFDDIRTLQPSFLLATTHLLEHVHQQFRSVHRSWSWLYRVVFALAYSARSKELSSGRWNFPSRFWADRFVHRAVSHMLGSSLQYLVVLSEGTQLSPKTAEMVHVVLRRSLRHALITPQVCGFTLLGVGARRPASRGRRDAALPFDPQLATAGPTAFAVTGVRCAIARLELVADAAKADESAGAVCEQPTLLEVPTADTDSLSVDAGGLPVVRLMGFDPTCFDEGELLVRGSTVTANLAGETLRASPRRRTLSNESFHAINGQQDRGSHDAPPRGDTLDDAGFAPSFDDPSGDEPSIKSGVPLAWSDDGDADDCDAAWIPTGFVVRRPRGQTAGRLRALRSSSVDGSSDTGMYVLGHKNSLLRLGDGAWALAERLENLYRHRCVLVKQVWVYAQPGRELVAICVAEHEQCYNFVRRYHGSRAVIDVQALCSLPQTVGKVMSDFQQAADQLRLPRSHRVQALCLTPVNFHPGTGLATPTQELRRDNLLQHFRADVVAMYAALENAGSGVAGIVTRNGIAVSKSSSADFVSRRGGS